MKRQLDQPEGERVETGAVRFGYDWPGYFMRGDYALHIALAIKAFRPDEIPKGHVIQWAQVVSMANNILEETDMSKWTPEDMGRWRNAR